MRQKLVVGNWKMHGSKAVVESLLSSLLDQLQDLADVSVAVCPPYAYLQQVQNQLEASSIDIGAQNVCAETQGAFTGEISAQMLLEFACRWVIVGHSERRALYSENDQTVAAKFVAAQDAGLTPILCVGESLAQRQGGDTLNWIEGQLRAVIERAGIEAFAKSVIAYEPIWAIGTGETASPEQAQEVHQHIRRVLASLDAVIADNVSILYGGSVKANNAEELFAKPDIDGGLVGGASLDAPEFAAICKAASN